MRVRLPDEIFMISCISVYAIFGQGIYPRDVFWGNGCCHSTTTVIVFQRSRSRHELCEPPQNSGYGRRLISKTVFSTLKALLKRFSLAVAIIHHSSKIPSRKVNTAVRRHAILTGYFVTWNENGCADSSFFVFCGFFFFFLVKSIMKLVYDVV